MPRNSWILQKLISIANFFGGNMSAKDSLSAKVTRGQASWAYIYVALGFAIAIEGSIIQMITPLIFPWNVVAFAVVAALTFWIFIFNGWFQNKLIGWKNKYEMSAR